MKKNEFKFKIGDILIQEYIYKEYNIISKIKNYHIGVGECGYWLEYKPIIPEYCFFSKNIIENGNSYWLPARLLTDEEKIKLL